MAIYKDDKSKLDTASIKTTTLFSFVVFALFLLAVLWGLVQFFIDTYYERARTQEVIRTANVLETEFRQNPEGFSKFAIQTAGTSGIYIRLDTPSDSLVYDGTSSVEETATLSEDIEPAEIPVEELPDGE